VSATVPLGQMFKWPVGGSAAGGASLAWPVVLVTESERTCQRWAISTRKSNERGIANKAAVARARALAVMFRRSCGVGRDSAGAAVGGGRGVEMRSDLQTVWLQVKSFRIRPDVQNDPPQTRSHH
jgi:hypothetical protein